MSGVRAGNWNESGYGSLHHVSAGRLPPKILSAKVTTARSSPCAMTSTFEWVVPNTLRDKRSISALSKVYQHSMVFILCYEANMWRQVQVFWLSLAIVAISQLVISVIQHSKNALDRNVMQFLRNVLNNYQRYRAASPSEYYYFTMRSVKILSTLLAAEVSDVIIHGRLNVYHITSVLLALCEIGYILIFYIFQRHKESQYKLASCVALSLLNSVLIYLFSAVWHYYKQ